MRRIFSILIMARLIQRLVNGSRSTSRGKPRQTGARGQQASRGEPPQAEPAASRPDPVPKRDDSIDR